ncbi:MAG TPA: N-methyl-L-tryptophan oxidase [bacterium]|nr:N-methyl-L-tryptophan oxidase [bacterium]
MTYDAIVVGLGAMGSAAAYHLARRGRRVLGLDGLPPGHRLGSSHGYTRVIRKAYFENPAYVPLLRRAYELWTELSEESVEPLYQRTGGLWLGAKSAAVVDGALASARTHGVAYELLSPADVRRRFPVFAPRDDMVALFEPDAGVLFPDPCILAHLSGAARAGAYLRYDQPVLRWEAGGERAAVETPAGRHEAGVVVVTAGPWAPALLRSLSLPIEATRRIVGWFAPAAPEQAPLLQADVCPVWICDLHGTNIYGVPDVGDGHGLKAAIHERGPACTPDTCRREVGEDEVAQLTEVLRKVLPAAAGRLIEAETCLYTMTPDWHFVIDRPAAQRTLLYATGFSGHGFKFAPVVGEILADLAVDGRTSHEVGFLSPARFAGATPQPRT